jgi:SAM-dependent methyltransferase
MSDADRDKWERRYAEPGHEARTNPTRLLVDWLPRLPKPADARALDLACGAGRNAHYLAAEGYRVDAMDISSVALERGAARAAELGVEVNWIAVDLDSAELPPDRYDLVVVARYMNRGLTEALMETLRDGGHLLYEQHLQTDQEVSGPSSDRFRLRPNELLEMFDALRVLYYREGLTKDPDGPTMALAQLVACKGSPGF